jgi:hypothetical protein
MGDVERIIEQMRRRPAGVRFRDLERVCRQKFGKPRQSGTSHQFYPMPWPGRPLVNIQNRGGMAVSYQVRQVLAAIDKLEGIGDERIG